VAKVIEMIGRVQRERVKPKISPELEQCARCLRQIVMYE